MCVCCVWISLGVKPTTFVSSNTEWVIRFRYSNIQIATVVIDNDDNDDGNGGAKQDDKLVFL